MPPTPIVLFVLQNRKGMKFLWGVNCEKMEKACRLSVAAPSVGNNKMLSIIGYLCQINWYRDGIAYLFRNRRRHCSYIKRIDSAMQSVGVPTYLVLFHRFHPLMSLQGPN